LDFYKLRFSMPGLKRSAQLGRLMYLVHEATCSVRLVWIYTHDEFDSRPPEVDLRNHLRTCADRALADLIDAPFAISTPTGRMVKVTVTFTPSESEHKS